jgi:hypothetical protein
MPASTSDIRRIRADDRQKNVRQQKTPGVAARGFRVSLMRCGR